MNCLRVWECIRHRYRTAGEIQALTGLKLYEVMQIIAELRPLMMLIGSDYAYKGRRQYHES
jgi:hypothetical protein